MSKSGTDVQQQFGLCLLFPVSLQTGTAAQPLPSTNLSALVHSRPRHAEFERLQDEYCTRFKMPVRRRTPPRRAASRERPAAGRRRSRERSAAVRQRSRSPASRGSRPPADKKPERRQEEKKGEERREERKEERKEERTRSCDKAKVGRLGLGGSMPGGRTTRCIHSCIVLSAAATFLHSC